MKNVLIIFLFVFVFFSCSSIGQQSYASHRVQEGETVSSIANKYNITVYELYRLNPEASDDLYPGLVLILPGNKTVNTETASNFDGKFKIHKVKKGETVFRLSKIYDVPVDVIKRYNTQLYAAELRTGEEIKIPVDYKEGASEIDKPTNTNRKHIVKPKETKYGLAAMYGITIEELEELNPDIKNGLKEGAILNVPDKSYTKNAVIEDSEYGFYEVQQGENIFRLTKRWDLTEEELVALNPSLADGLKNGMILKVPKSLILSESAKGNAGQIDLAQNLTNFSTKNIALMLPLNLSKTVVDTADVRKNVIREDGVMRIALDFYSGALMAVDSVKSLGISTKLSVYDTQYVQRETAGNARKIENIISNNDFSKTDAVIGPFVGANVEKTSALLSRYKVPVVSPITPKIDMSSNIFQSRPSEDVLRQKMVDYIAIAATGKNVIIIADGKNSKVKNEILNRFPNAKVVDPRKGEKGLYLNANDLDAKISATLENWIVLETNDIPLVSNVTTNLSTKVADKKITLLTTYKGSAYDSDDVSNITLMNLNFHYPSIDKEFLFDSSNSFVNAYREKYGIDPNSYAVRGFDLTLDTLLRLASAEDLYASAESGYETLYVENKFNYVKDAAGYDNKAVYIMKYGPDLSLEEVIVPSDVIDKLDTLKD
ncbi:MAG: LysM peptidoglycan-binding domain-containing protein [Leeuwenhoekiella sp.]